MGQGRRGVPEGVGDVVRRGRVALLVYDMQVGIVGRMPGARPVVDRAAAALAHARRAGVPVFFVRHWQLPKELMSPAQLRGAMAMARARDPETFTPPFTRDAPGFPIVDELAPRADEAVVDKLGMSAFVDTPLATAWHGLGVDAFAVVGAVLEIGIEPTVRHGADLGFLPVVLTDGCVHLSDDGLARSRAGTAMSAFWSDVDTFGQLLDTEETA